MDLTNDQSAEWTTLVQRQLNELNSLGKQHTKEKCDLLRSLLDETQTIQTKELMERHTRLIDLKSSRSTDR